jgi:hypothetical protein
MRRGLAVVALTAFAVAGFAAPALAKGEDQKFRASVVIVGPGLNRPVGMSGTIHGFLFSEQTKTSKLGTLFRQSGLVGFVEPGSGYYTISPDTATLGPRYEVSYTLQLADTTNPVVEDLYPYANGGPVVFAHPGQRIEGAKVPSAWYVAPRSLLTTLVGLGLPRTAPAVTAPAVSMPPPSAPAVPAPATEPVSVPSGSGWPWAIAVFGFAALLVVGALAGRRGRVRIA